MTALRTRRLGDIAEEVSERIGPRSATPVFAVTKHAGFVPSADYFKKRVHSADTSKYKRVRRGEFAYATIHLDEGSVGLLEDPDEAAISPMYTVFRVDEREVWQPFLFRLLKSPRMLSKYPALGSGTVHRRKSIPFRRLAELRLELPKVEEQKRLAAILDKADAIHRKGQETIALGEHLLRSTFLKMFGDPATNPLGWALKPISQLAVVTTGNTPPRARSELYGGSLEWIKSDNINTPSHYLTPAQETLSDLGRERARIVGAGATLITCIAGSADCIGNAAMADREVAFNQQINALEPRDGVDAFFLYGQVLVAKRLVQAASTKSMKGLVSKNRLEAVEFMSPPEERQREFGRWFRAWDRLAQRTRSALRLQDNLLGSLSQRSFQGEL